LKVLTVEEKVILSVFCYISIKIMLKINRERRKKKNMRKISVLGIKKSAAVSGAPGAPPLLDPLM